PLSLLRLGAGFRQRRPAQRLGPGAPREHARRPVRRALDAGPALLRRGRWFVTRPGPPDRVAPGNAAAAAPGADAASHLRRRPDLRPAAPRGRADALARRLVAPFHRPGSPGCVEHGRGPAGHRLLDGRANISGGGGPISPDLLVRPETGFAASVFVDRGAQERAACSPHHTP